jgi:hypothetical protein
MEGHVAYMRGEEDNACRVLGRKSRRKENTMKT